MLQGVTLEAVVQYTLDFIDEVGLPNTYENKQALVDIKGFRGVLPCDLLDVIQVRDEKTGVMLTDMKDSFNGHSFNVPGGARTFKASNHIITTSFENGQVRVAYHAVKVDEEGFPMLPDNPTFMQALETFIKMKVFEVLYEEGKIKYEVLGRVETNYYWLKGRCRSLFRMPSETEMESLTGMMHRLIPSRREFQAGYKGMGDRELFKIH